GSFAIAGGYAGIYPRAMPGGWQILGRTNFPCFDAYASPPAAFAPGDRVRVRVMPAVPQPLPAAERGRLRYAGERRAVVVRPGVQSLVQDLGRRGVAAIGVPRGGAADPVRLRVANRAVGNHDTSPAIEVLVGGLSVRFESSAYIALCGDAPLLL